MHASTPLYSPLPSCPLSRTWPTLHLLFLTQILSWPRPLPCPLQPSWLCSSAFGTGSHFSPFQALEPSLALVCPPHSPHPTVLYQPSSWPVSGMVMSELLSPAPHTFPPVLPYSEITDSGFQKELPALSTMRRAVPSSKLATSWPLGAGDPSPPCPHPHPWPVPLPAWLSQPGTLPKAHMLLAKSLRPHAWRVDSAAGSPQPAYRPQCM